MRDLVGRNGGLAAAVVERGSFESNSQQVGMAPSRLLHPIKRFVLGVGGEVGESGAGEICCGDSDGARFGPGLQVGGAQDRESSGVGKEFKSEVTVG